MAKYKSGGRMVKCPEGKAATRGNAKHPESKPPQPKAAGLGSKFDKRGQHT